ncbi:TetR family transcriptional regulator [Fodinicurvata sp. EGI_FJ10296]|uniref:TetR family transcriptional regulator n=1 Tax=Fodinicurvata sp. EGI_FJ10296 TaxID=3231908 RepID=UPI0034573A21
MAKSTDPSEKLVEAALDIAAEQGWRRVSPAGAAARAGLGIAHAYDCAGDRGRLLALIVRSVDLAVLRRIDVEDEDPARERLFDVLMTRFDVLNEHRDAFLSILLELPESPAVALCSVPRLETSMRWMLEAAGIEARGVAGGATVRGLCLLWIAVLRVWAADDSADMARTMAALDQRLSQAEQWASSLTPRLEALDRFFVRAAETARSRGKRKVDSGPTDELQA